MASGYEVALGRIVPGYLFHDAKIRRVVIRIGGPFQIRNVEIPNIL